MAQLWSSQDTQQELDSMASSPGALGSSSASCNCSAEIKSLRQGQHRCTQCQATPTAPTAVAAHGGQEVKCTADLRHVRVRERLLHGHAVARVELQHARHEVQRPRVRPRELRRPVHRLHQAQRANKNAVSCMQHRDYSVKGLCWVW